MQPRLFFSREQIPVTLVTALSHSVFEYEAEIARLPLLWICLNYVIGCLGKDHFEGKSATMFEAVFVALLLVRFSHSDSGQPRGSFI